MSFKQIVVDCTENQAELAEGILLDQGALSVTFEDAEDVPILEPPVGQTPLWAQLKVKGLFDAETELSTVLSVLHDFLPDNLMSVFTVKDQVWERVWLEHFKPIKLGERLWICSHQHPSVPEPAVVVRLDPGLAFGTGTHPTTALCLEWLDSAKLTSQTVLDYGCGSGILAIAALLLGAGFVYAVDNDPQALWATTQNAQDNQIDPKTLQVESPEAFSAESVDIVMANILAGPLQELAPLFARLLSTGSPAVLSGILENQIPLLHEAYRPYFNLESQKVQEGWVRLVYIKK